MQYGGLGNTAEKLPHVHGAASRPWRIPPQPIYAVGEHKYHPAPPTSLTLVPRRRPFFFRPNHLIPKAPASSSILFFFPHHGGHYHTFDGALPLPTFSCVHYHRAHISLLFTFFLTHMQTPHHHHRRHSLQNIFVLVSS